MKNSKNILNEIEEFVGSVNNLLVELKKISKDNYTDKQVYSILYLKEKGIQFQAELKDYYIEIEQSDSEKKVKSVILENIKMVEVNLTNILHDINILDDISKVVPIEYKPNSLEIDGYITKNSVLNSSNPVSVEKICYYTELSDNTIKALKTVVSKYIIYFLLSLFLIFAAPSLTNLLTNFFINGFESFNFFMTTETENSLEINSIEGVLLEEDLDGDFSIIVNTEKPSEKSVKNNPIEEITLEELDNSSSELIKGYIHIILIVLNIGFIVCVLLNAFKMSIHLVYISFPYIREGLFKSEIYKYIDKDIRDMLSEDALLEVKKTRVVNLVEYVELILFKLKYLEYLSNTVFEEMHKTLLSFDYSKLTYANIKFMVDIEMLGELRNKEYNMV